jgi:hypothetical protein
MPSGEFRFTLLTGIGSAKVNVPVTAGTGARSPGALQGYGTDRLIQSQGPGRSIALHGLLVNAPLANALMSTWPMTRSFRRSSSLCVYLGGIPDRLSCDDQRVAHSLDPSRIMRRASSRVYDRLSPLM